MVEVTPNRIIFAGKAGQGFYLPYTAFVGWRAFENGRRISIEDANPGMVVTPLSDGPVTLLYRFRHYFTP